MSISSQDVAGIIAALGQMAIDDIAWSEACCAPEDAEEFAWEAIFVICNSGMKNTVARGIYHRVRDALLVGKPASAALGHKGKCGAIDDVWTRREARFAGYMNAADKVEYCATLPWIGAITKYHLAKNFGAQVAKPDVHLQRLADREGTTAQALCERLAADTGYKVATVDLILWRACATGVLNSRTGALAFNTDGAPARPAEVRQSTPLIKIEKC